MANTLRLALNPTGGIPFAIKYAAMGGPLITRGIMGLPSARVVSP